MTLSALIRKGGLRQAATAIPATAATGEGKKAGSVAGIATIAVANSPSPETFDREAFDERAGIAEFDGGLPRAEAEARAFACCVAEWMNRSFERSPPGYCLGCGGGDHAHDPLLPFGTETTGHVWLHSHCWPAWHAGRKAEAVAALKAMGIKINEDS